MHNLTVVLFAIVVTIPPAAKVLAVATAIYATMQALKALPWLQPYLKGWIAIVINVVFSIIGILVEVGTTQGADAIYTWTTLVSVVQAIGVAAGIHGTVRSLVQQKQENDQKNIDNPPPTT